MRNLTDEQVEFIIERLKEGKPLPEEFKWLLFEGKQEAELGYFGKERDIDIITETMAVPLQRVKSFGEIKENEWNNMPKENCSEWTKQELIREIKKLKKRKKYGIVWEDKPEKVAELCKEKLPILEEDKNKEIKTDENKSINILIEGDNYHALIFRRCF